ncbi:YgaP-like transmembrane domain [Azospirillum sp. sgz302134]
MTAENAIRHTYDRFFGGEQNLSSMERALSTGLGLIMAAGGVRRGADWRGAVMGLAGAALVARGMSGHCPMKAMMTNGGAHRLGNMGGGNMGGGNMGEGHMGVGHREDMRSEAHTDPGDFARYS